MALSVLATEAEGFPGLPPACQPTGTGRENAVPLCQGVKSGLWGWP